MAEVTSSVQPGEDEIETRPHHCLQIFQEGKRGAGTYLCSSVTADRTRGNGAEVVSGKV